MGLVEMKVQGIARAENGQHVVVLREGSGIGGEWTEWALPIVIGAFEALAISSELQAHSMPRPMSHDLIRNVLAALDADVSRICVTDLRDGIFYAIIYLERGGQVFEIDSRPSDAIAIALRTGAPIFVDEGVLAEARVSVEESDSESGEVDTFRNLIERIEDAEDDLDDDEV